MTNPPRTEKERINWQHLAEGLIIYCNHPGYLLLGKNEEECIFKKAFEYNITLSNHFDDFNKNSILI